MAASEAQNHLQHAGCKAGTGPIEVVAIATSTGGPSALAEVLPQLPMDLPAAILVVQHMPPAFTRFLAERLNSACRMPVTEASENFPLRPGKILIAPGDYHMALEQRGMRTFVRTLRTPPENSCRPLPAPGMRSPSST
jgi:two-component system chemotaxis response regulator CheB